MKLLKAHGVGWARGHVGSGACLSVYIRLGAHRSPKQGYLSHVYVYVCGGVGWGGSQLLQMTEQGVLWISDVLYSTSLLGG
jgi:hypothetical protein